ncbi:MAG TPA: hypothetical protein PKE30_15210 [Niabella sp.]|nr:hypothetical protein [Niabella sp.]
MAKQYHYIPGLITLTVIMALYSCDDILDQDVSKELVILVAPSDSVVSADSVQKFAWEHIRPLSDYQLQIVSPWFDSIVILHTDTIAADNLIEVTLKKGRQYQWRVRAINGLYSSVYSNPRTLIIQ